MFLAPAWALVFLEAAQFFFSDGNRAPCLETELQARQEQRGVGTPAVAVDDLSLMETTYIVHRSHSVATAEDPEHQRQREAWRLYLIPVLRASPGWRTVLLPPLQPVPGAPLNARRRLWVPGAMRFNTWPVSTACGRFGLWNVMCERLGLDLLIPAAGTSDARQLDELARLQTWASVLIGVTSLVAYLPLLDALRSVMAITGANSIWYAGRHRALGTLCLLALLPIECG